MYLFIHSFIYLLILNFWKESRENVMSIQVAPGTVTWTEGPDVLSHRLWNRESVCIGSEIPEEIFELCLNHSLEESQGWPVL